MFDTFITIVGNVCTQVVHRELSSGPVAEFRIASTSRRFDKQRDTWTDGDELFIRVNCYRSLATNVHQSVQVGDPLIVRGRLYSRRYSDKTGVARTSYEVNAQAVGHDLSRGIARFTRQRDHNRNPGNTASGGEVSREFDAIVESLHSTIASETASETGAGAVQP